MCGKGWTLPGQMMQARPLVSVVDSSAYEWRVWGAQGGHEWRVWGAQGAGHERKGVGHHQ